MSRIKLFENFQDGTLDDIDDMLISLIDRGLLKIKNKPYFSYEESYDEEGEYQAGIPKIFIRYYITQDLGMINSIEKLDNVIDLLNEFKDSLHRLDQFSSYMIDLGRKELEIKLSVPNNIKDIFDRVSINDESAGFRYNYDEDIDYVPYDVRVSFMVDENLKILVSLAIKTKGVTHTIQQLEEPMKKHFTQYELKYVQTRDMIGTWIWEFITE